MAESADEENKSFTYKVINGEITKHYKGFKITFQVTSQGQGYSLKLTIEYEKANEEVPTPTKYLNFGINLTKAVGAYLLIA